MKRCPVCNRAYDDGTLNFCEEDGATLVAFNSGYGQSSGFGSSGGQNFGSTYPPVVRPPQKASALPWVLGVFGTLIVLGVLGIIGLVALVGTLPDNKNNNGTTRVNNSNKGGIFTGSSPSNKSSAANGYKIDFTRWSDFDKPDGKAQIIGDEYQLVCKQQNYYYVVVASTKFDEKLVTNNSTAHVTVRSVTGESPELGFGIVVNSDTKPLENGYAFLIYTGDAPKYRVVRHIDRKETVVKEWTAASQIRSGTQPNQLEVRSGGGKMAFYINGQLATTVTDESDNDQGIIGVYSSDTETVGFSNMEIIKN